MPILGIDASRAVKKEKTGVEWYSYFLLRAMERCTPEGWRVRLYTPQMKHEATAMAGQAWSMEHKNWSWKQLQWIGRGWTQGRLSIEMMRKPPDVLFVPSHTLPLVHPRKSINTVHDVVFLNHPELYDPEDLESQRRGLEFALKFSKKIIVPSNAVREDLLRAGAKEGLVTVVAHGVEIAMAPSVPRNDEFGKYILFVGRIEKKKNVMRLIHAFRELLHTPSPQSSPTSGEEGKLKLILAGSPGYGAEDIDLALKTFHLEEKVLRLGWVSRARYHALLQQAALLVLPSIGEGFGLPVLEAMAAGTPVVCADIPVLHEAGGDAVQYVNPFDVEHIAGGIAQILTQDEATRNVMIARGKVRAAEFTWEIAAHKTWEVITSL